jgi:hypothetical protein
MIGQNLIYKENGWRLVKTGEKIVDNIVKNWSKLVKKLVEVVEILNAQHEYITASAITSPIVSVQLNSSLISWVSPIIKLAV